jgi:hypothetical protein
MTETESGILVVDEADVRSAVTSGGLKLPYPVPTDPVAGGAAAIQALAETVEKDLLAWTFVAIPGLGTKQTDNFGWKSTGQFAYLPWAPVRAAGLVWEFRLFGEHWSNQANLYGNIRLWVAAYPSAGSALINIGPAALSNYTVPTSPLFYDSDWSGPLSIGGPATDSYKAIRLGVETQADNTGQLTFSNVSVVARLVAL